MLSQRIKKKIHCWLCAMKLHGKQHFARSFMCEPKSERKRKKKNANGIYINQVIRVYVELIALVEFWAAFSCDILHLNSKKKKKKKRKCQIKIHCVISHNQMHKSFACLQMLELVERDDMASNPIEMYSKEQSQMRVASWCEQCQFDFWKVLHPNSWFALQK